MTTPSKTSNIKTTTDAVLFMSHQLARQRQGPTCTPVMTAAKPPVPQASLPSPGIGPRRERKDETVSSTSPKETLARLRTKGVAKRLANGLHRVLLSLPSAREPEKIGEKSSRSKQLPPACERRLSALPSDAQGSAGNAQGTLRNRA